jgi:predicted O-methyltransferase YrrM
MNALGKALRLAANLGRIAARKPSRLRHILGTALTASEEVAVAETDLLELPQVTLDEIQSGPGERITLQMFPDAHAAVSPLEFIALVLLMKKARAKRVFEFGTYKGVSITQLALNLPADAMISTLDLPDAPIKTRYAVTAPEDSIIARESGKGALVPGDLKPRIQFLKQDSAEFDEKQYAGQMDFVFVDGAHNAEYVRNDSEKGWAMLRSGGIIAWHDCRPADPEVVRYLLQCSFRPRRITGTTLAFSEKP